MKILIPYNFTGNDEKSIDWVCREYLEKNGADITLFHAFAPAPVVDTLNNPIMEKVNRGSISLRLAQEEQKKTLDWIRQTLVDRGFRSGAVRCVFEPIKQDVAADIIKWVEKEKYDVVVLNRNPGNIINYFTRSISKRLTRHFGRSIRIHIAN